MPYLPYMKRLRSMAVVIIFKTFQESYTLYTGPHSAVTSVSIVVEGFVYLYLTRISVLDNHVHVMHVFCMTFVDSFHLYN